MNSATLKFAAGTLLILLALFMAFRSWMLLPESMEWWNNNSVSTKGTVIQLRETYRNRSYCYYPVIEFTAGDGKYYTFTTYDCYSKGTYSIDQSVPVRYLRSDPSTAYLDSKAHDAATVIAIYAICAIMLLAGTVLLLLSIRGGKIHKN